ncbi:hypothetical protein OAF42_00970 [Planctomicrobium sp.]|nr:hypothetical protein [Planctomicrobium sp.]MBT5017350.1 hypothetical protein [Planctomicrobium sp.]MDB4732990.1 hypothetical protein [Planctomicrobium sp.]
MKESLPVTGQFSIETKFNEEYREKVTKLVKQRANSVGSGLVTPDPEKIFLCRWTFDGTRELLEPLSGSKGNVHEKFMYGDDFNLVGTTANSFNLERMERRPDPVRPASFYHMVSGVTMWDLVGNSTVTNSGHYDGNPDWTTFQLDSTPNLNLPGFSAQLVINVQTKALQEFSISWDEILVTKIEITNYFETEDGKKFPQSAIQKLFHGDLVVRTDYLTATEVEFPESPADIESAFKMILREGTQISDMLLDKIVVLQNDTSVSEFMNKSEGWRERSENFDPLTDISKRSPSKKHISFRLLIWLNICAVALIGIVYFINRGRKIRKKL